MKPGITHDVTIGGQKRMRRRQTVTEEESWNGCGGRRLGVRGCRRNTLGLLVPIMYTNSTVLRTVCYILIIPLLHPGNYADSPFWHHWCAVAAVLHSITCHDRHEQPFPPSIKSNPANITDMSSGWWCYSVAILLNTSRNLTRVSTSHLFCCK